VGRVVYSKSGRDKGKTMVVIDIVNEQYCLVADGDIRRIEKPKLKNIKHLQLSNVKANEVLECMTRGEIPENHVIRNSLKKILGAGEIEGKEGW